MVKAGTIGVAHHGESTDQLFKAGRIDKVADFIKRVKDAGMMAGVSTHMPAVVDAIESKGWDLDYYMTCVYQRHRTKEELEKLLGHAPLPIGEVYLTDDPPRMYKAVRQTKRPCLAFKILAAGRLSDHHQWVEDAFQQAFQSIKPGDGVIVGIYDRYTDQPSDDASLVRRFARKNDGKLSSHSIVAKHRFIAAGAMVALSSYHFAGPHYGRCRSTRSLREPAL